ncbi:MAG: hypothetical protein KAT70_03155 [Thermoplasmata archaeon]|nr:hypothetical protein [Thermoplasmata archaeon]
MTEDVDIAWEACEKLLAFAPQEDVDDYARKQLRQEFTKRKGVKLQTLARIEFVVNKHQTPNLLEALANVETIEEMGANFTGMSMKPIWEYDTPTRRLKVDKLGRGRILHFPRRRTASGVGWDPLGDPFMERAMLRVYTTKWFIPENIHAVTERPDDVPPAKPPGLLPPHVWWEKVRSMGLVPFEVVVCAYTQEKRFMFTLDLVNNVSYKDFRQGLFSRKREERDVLDFMYLDTAFATNKLKEIQKRAMTYLFEVESATAQEVAHGFKITEKMAQNHLFGLVKKGLLRSEGQGRLEIYSPDLENLRKTKGDI